MDIAAQYDSRTNTLTYLVSDPATGDAVVIDPVLGFDPATGKVWTESVGKVEAALASAGLRLRGILETHVHADHLSGANVLRERSGAPVVVGRGIITVQERFAPVFSLGEEFPRDGRQFDRLAGDGEVVAFGSLSARCIHTPGHTPACVTWQFTDAEAGDALFTGDALFMPDGGVGRCDFPDGCSEQLYDSVHGRLYGFPETTRVFVGHDYQPGGRALAWQTTIGESRRSNVQLPASRSRDEFVAARCARDATLAAPKLLFYSLQVNMAAGRLPPAGPDGKRYLLQPLNVVE